MSSQKSKDKNIALEDQHRRNEISMRRKAAQTGLANPLSPNALSSDSDAPKSPASTGAMDDLLQKLRAAKPEARDQRDRRRRARLKDRHQVRVASGQQIPELGINVEDGEGGEGGEDEDGAESKAKALLSPTSETAESENSATGASLASPTDADVADRAAAMLGDLTKDGSLSVRRRRESADTERQRRRNRRNQAGSSRATDEGGLMSPTTIPEEFLDGENAGGGGGSVEDGELGRGPGTPVTIVHPPSPEAKGRELPTPPPE